MTEQVILVDIEDNVLGTMDKMDAHVHGKLHRAFSVFIFNKAGELLLQQRAIDKYHSGGKWTNTCCSHPRLGEETVDAAHRRLKEEMGMECDLQYAFNFTYKAQLLGGIAENEYDHVYFGVSDDLPIPDPLEVSAFKYISMEALSRDMQENQDEYTEWLKICFERVQHSIKRLL
ncbi:isopentenyl-diphosphate Delta-isomerase [Pedobacter sp. JCM 36344]|uniref:isopentenyl-diphosphate Delta-isomerase n=1 Tax=Pedobacter sp. JCM 36344 TaxID=3374280 RepID=UPI0039786686